MGRGIEEVGRRQTEGVKKETAVGRRVKIDLGGGMLEEAGEGSKKHMERVR